jgi:hypothetical protein
MMCRLSSIALLALVLTWAIPAHPQQPAWLATLQQKLSPYQLTKVSKDATTILEPGTKFVMKKGGMGVERAVSGGLGAPVAENSYKNGEIKPDFSAILQNWVEKGDAIMLPEGEKVWVAQIVPRKNEIELVLVTDLVRRALANGVIADQLHVDGVRYWGILKFPIPKGTEPDADQIYSSMLEVLSPEDSSPSAFCNALVKLRSSVLLPIVEKTVLPNGEFPDQQGENANTDTFHYESLALRGDHAQQIHTTVQNCLPGLTVSQPVTLQDGVYKSTLSGYDAPYNISFVISSKLEPDGVTFVGIGFNRVENEAQERLDNAAIAYIAVAVDTCNWPLQTPAQAQNINRLLGNRSGSFQEELDFANKHIADVGRLDFCSDPKEREKFDRLVPTLWPVGSVGKP